MKDTRIHGYARVSSKEQKEDRQVNQLTEYGISDRDMYVDKITGNTNSRPALNSLLNVIRKGDLVVVTSIDRLGRNYDLIQEVWQHITKDLQADIKVLDMPLLDTSNAKNLDSRFIADLTLQILSYVAQKERESIKARQAQGIANAKDNGVAFGRPKATFPPKWREVHKRWRSGEITATAAMQELGVKRNTFYKLDKRYLNHPEMTN